MSANSGADRGGPAAQQTALRDYGALACFGLAVVAGLALDLSSKHWVFSALGYDGRRVLIPHVLEFQTMMNDGALFGIGGGRTTLFLVASLLALVLVGWMFVHSPARARLLHLALGAILAGALGNMYDRVAVQLVDLRRPGARYFVKSESADHAQVFLREYAPPPGQPPRELTLSASRDLPEPVGYVRDFLKIPTRLWGEHELWPWVFNVADMLLVCGVAVLAQRMWRERRQPRRTRPPSPARG